VESDGIEWNGVGWSHVPLFGFVKKEWNGMECDGTHSSDTTHLSNFPFPQFGVYPIEWNTLIIHLQFWPFCFFFSFSLRVLDSVVSLYPECKNLVGILNEDD